MYPTFKVSTHSVTGSQLSHVDRPSDRHTNEHVYPYCVLSKGGRDDGKSGIAVQCQNEGAVLIKCNLSSTAIYATPAHYVWTQTLNI